VNAVNADLKPATPAGRHDPAQRRKSSRKGRERGCSLYLAGEELAEAGIDPHGPPPEYKVWPGRKRTVLIQLYAVGDPQHGDAHPTRRS
jgi:hypothetical protein